MSTDWNVYCRTCDSEHYFCDANHREPLMHRLIKHAKAIGELSSLVDGYEVELRTSFGQIRPDWFREHAGHELVPRDEYGRCADQCGENVTCECCGTRSRCALPLGHEGLHAGRFK